MTAFKDTIAKQINENITTLFKRLKMVSKMTITHEQFLSLFVPAEHREMFRAMANLSDTGTWRRAHCQWSNSKLMFHLNESGAYPPPVPRDMVLQHDAPADLVESISAWIRKGGDASADFGRVSAVFNKLNEELTKPQIRFVWPSIIALCNVTEVLGPTAAELQELKPIGGVALPRGLLQACRKTAATIALAGLIPADIAARPEGEVTVEAVDGRALVEEGLGKFTGMST